MFPITATLSSALLFVCVFTVVSADHKNITAQSGQDVTLTCRAPNIIIIGVKWSRADLEPEYVLFYRDEQFDPENQHPFFMNRVDLQDRQMKDGDVSLILKNVTINDTGTYQCGVIQTGTLKFLSSISLSVDDPPGQTGGDKEDGGKEDGGKKDGGKEEQSVGLIAGLSVPALLLVAAVVGFLLYRKHKKQKHPHQPSDDLQHGNGSTNHTESEKPALLKQTEG